jgi:hypothetical protein
MLSNKDMRSQQTSQIGDEDRESIRSSQHSKVAPSIRSGGFAPPSSHTVQNDDVSEREDMQDEDAGQQRRP